jgi:hypothetical protein
MCMAFHFELCTSSDIGGSGRGLFVAVRGVKDMNHSLY